MARARSAAAVLPALLPGAARRRSRLPGRRVLPRLVGAARGGRPPSRWRCAWPRSSAPFAGLQRVDRRRRGRARAVRRLDPAVGRVVGRARARAGRVRPPARLPARARPLRVARAARAPALVGAARPGAGDRRDLRAGADHPAAAGHLRQRGQRVRPARLPAHLLERARHARRDRRRSSACTCRPRAASRGRSACWPRRCPPIAACTVYLTLSRGGIVATVARPRALPRARLLAGDARRAAGDRADRRCTRCSSAYDAELLVDDDRFGTRRRPGAGPRRRHDHRSCARSPRSRCERLGLLVDRGARAGAGPGAAAGRGPGRRRRGRRRGRGRRRAGRWARRRGPSARSTSSSIPRSPRSAAPTSADRLTVFTSNGRVEHWDVALDAWRGDRLKGTGAGTFQNEWNRERDRDFQVLDAHSLYIETLGEMGVVGLVAARRGAAGAPGRPRDAAARPRPPGHGRRPGRAGHLDDPRRGRLGLGARRRLDLASSALAGIALARAPGNAARRELPRLLRLVVALGLLAAGDLARRRSGARRCAWPTRRAAFRAGDCPTTIDAALDSLVGDRPARGALGADRLLQRPARPAQARDRRRRGGRPARPRQLGVPLRAGARARRRRRGPAHRRRGRPAAQPAAARGPARGQGARRPASGPCGSAARAACRCTSGRRRPRYPVGSTSRRCGVFLCPAPTHDSRSTPSMARGDVRIAVTLACEECKRRNYQTNKSKRNNPDRISLRKYCRWCRRHTGHRETR